MRRLLAAALCMFLPLKALGDAQAVCDAALVSAGEFAGAMSAARVEARNGWCEVEPTDQSLLGVRFQNAKFRVDQLSIAPAGARSLEIEVETLETAVGPLEGSLTLSWQDQTGAISLHAFLLEGDDGRRLRAVAEGLMVATDGRGLTPDLLPSLTVGEVLAQFVVTPDFLAETGIDFSDLSRVAVDRALRDVAADQISRASRNEFQRFVGAAPNARGSLNVKIEASGDVRILDVVGPFIGLTRDPSEDAIASVFARALNGLRVDVTWQPGRM